MQFSIRFNIFEEKSPSSLLYSHLKKKTIRHFVPKGPSVIMFARFLFVFGLLVGVALAMNGDMTYYYPGGGITACGSSHSNNELIAATAFSWWTTGNPNVDPMCRKCARISRGGKSVVVRIKDKCSGCKRGDIDVTITAFRRLADPRLGRVRVSWKFVRC